MAKAIPLEKAYFTETIPPNGGFIISAFFDTSSTYTIYEITAYSNLKDIYQASDGISFRTDGNRTHMLVEPPTYPQKSLEPTNRDAGKSIPYRFYELETFTCRKHEKVMIPKEPTMLHSYFTIQKAAGDSFAFLFYLSEDVYLAIKKFIADSLYNDCNIDKRDAIEASKTLLTTIKKFSIWKG